MRRASKGFFHKVQEAVIVTDMISYLLWLAGFMFFVNYKGWSFGRTLKAVIPVIMVLSAFARYGFLVGTFFFLILASAVFVYGDAVREKFRFAWCYGLFAFFFPVVGLLVYLLRKWFHERSLVKNGQMIHYDDGEIPLYK